MPHPPLPAAKSITPEQFLTYSFLYEPLIKYLSHKPRRTPNFTPPPPSDLCALDDIRFNTLPATLQRRQKADGQAWMSKEELQEVMAWKLAHGTFRPTLPSLISSNPAQTVTKVTKAAFARHNAIHDGSHESPVEVLKDLSQLRGVGPATASLLLSIYQPSVIVFLSDELWRWVCWDEASGWQKKIRYTLIEWHELCLAVAELCKRLACKAWEVEKLAYVIGKFATTKGLEEEVRELAQDAMEQTAWSGIDMGDRAAIVMEIPEVKEARDREVKRREAREKQLIAEEEQEAGIAGGKEETVEADKQKRANPEKSVAVTRRTSLPAATAGESIKDETVSKKRKARDSRKRGSADAANDTEPVSKRTRKR